MSNSHKKEVNQLITAFQSGKISRRKFLSQASALGAAGYLATSTFNRALAAEPKKGGHLKIAMAHGATTDTLDPTIIENGVQWVAAYGVANTLTEVTADGKIGPALATAWEASPDAKRWVFKLREDVEFHNGKKMTAKDVVASINLHRGENSKSVGKAVMASVTDIRADGPSAVVVDLAGGNSSFPVNFNEALFGIYPEKDGAVDWRSGGSGPYKITSYDPGVKIEFERNPNYWKTGHAHIDTIELISIIDATARTNAIMSGAVDIIDQVDLKTAHLLERAPGITIEEGAGPLHYVFPMHTQTEPFNNLDVRKALKYAIDREEMVRKILRGHGTVGNDHPIGPSYRYHAKDIEQTQYDPDKAKFHMKRANIGNVEINFSAADAAFSGAVDAALLYQASAKKAGININVIREPNDGYWSNVWNKKPWCVSYWGGYSTEDTMFTTGYAAGAAWNDSQWDNPRFEKLLVQARAELDETKQREMYREMQLLLRDEGGVVVPMFANGVTARRDTVSHGEVSWVRPLDGRRILERWWMS